MEARLRPANSRLSSVSALTEGFFFRLLVLVFATIFFEAGFFLADFLVLLTLVVALRFFADFARAFGLFFFFDAMEGSVPPCAGS